MKQKNNYAEYICVITLDENELICLRLAKYFDMTVEELFEIQDA